VRRRYRRSFQNLAAAIDRADHTILFDNSTEDGYRPVAILGANEDRSKEDHWFDPRPRWAKFII
jgi:predicted ABC-type ATPase